MDKMADTHHLVRRHDTWYFRRRVPTHLVEKVGSTILQYSLRTKNKAEAKRLGTIADAKADLMFQRIERTVSVMATGQRSGVSSSRDVPVEDLLEYVRSFVEGEDQRRATRLLNNPPEDEEERREMLANVETERTYLMTDGHPDQAVMIGDAADRIAAQAGMVVENGLHPTAFVSLVERALVEIARRQEARISKDNSHTHFDVAFAPRSSDLKPKMRIAQLSALFLDDIKAEHEVNGVSSRHTLKIAVALDFVTEALGPNTFVASIDDSKMQEMRRTVARTPANRTKVYKGLSLQEAIARAEKEGRATIQHLTQRTYLEVVRNLLKFAVRKKLLASNPADEIKPLLRETVSLSDKREPFSIEQLIWFFRGGFYRSCSPGYPEPYLKPDRVWRFWLPLIMLFSGARPNEICQLFVDDVKQTASGTWYFDLSDESESQSRKNQASRRRIPIHPELIKLGILQLIATRRKSVKKNGPRLFFELKPKSSDPSNFAWYAGKRFNEVFLPAEIEVGDRQALYSLRHTVRDALRRSKASDEALFAIGGWTPSGGRPVSSNYGDMKNPDLWFNEVASISYEGLDLAFLYPKN